jgi:general secretion pathway protein F
MPPFSYKAKDRNGVTVQGTIDADGRAAVVTRLQAMGYFPVSITAGTAGGGSTVVATKPAAAKAAPSKPAAATNGTPRVSVTVARPAGMKPAPAAKQKPADKPESKDKKGTATAGPGLGRQLSAAIAARRGIRTADIASFNRQMSDLLGAGVALVKALTILQKQTVNDQFRAIIADINAEVQGGKTFADALAQHPKQFSKLYIAMVRSGEAGGNLDEVLKKLADYSEQEEELRGRVWSALAYPMVMIGACTVAVVVMFIYVIPKIVGTFRELEQTLPPVTQLLITISDIIGSYGIFILAGVIVLIGLVWQFLSTEKGRAQWDRWQLMIPIFGDLVAKREVARFSRTLGSLLKNGVSILVALNITKEVVSNSITKSEVDEVIDEITQGEGVAAPLKRSQIFPPVAVNMMAVGEETGQLDNVLLRISQSFEVEVDRKLKTITSLIEPAIIIVMAVIVGFIVIAMLLPIFSLDPSGGGM